MKFSLQSPIYINAITSISSLGADPKRIWNSYLNETPSFKIQTFNTSELSVAPIPETIEKEIHTIQQEEKYKHLDRSVLLALVAARNLRNKLAVNTTSSSLSMGSSRGATHLLEAYHSHFLTHQKVPVRTSPTTTLGNLGAWVGQELGVNSTVMEHSVTCSSGMFALLNGVAWIQSGMTDRFIAGASEASLTPFTVAQMQALKLYSKKTTAYPCESLQLEKEQNTMVLGEGASLVVLEREQTATTKGTIIGVGTATENIVHGSSISNNAIALQHSMKRALEQAELTSVDVIVMHAPGTVKGDLAEYNAITKVFSKDIPLLTSNKWMLGHTLATSGLLSLEMALLMLENDHFIENKFYPNKKTQKSSLKTILINTIGFGGNAVSVIVRKPNQ